MEVIMKKIVSSFNLLTVFCLMLLSQTAFADPFMSYPGTRAKAMGGAFCGVADDASAVWYNPAGLAEGESFDLFLEWSQAISQEEDTKGNEKDLSQFGINPSSLTNEENKIFFSIKWADKIEQKDGGIALYYMSPYTIDWYFPPELELGKTFGNFKEDMNIFGFAFAGSSHNDRLLFGGSLEYINISFETDELKIINEYESPYYYYQSVNTRFDHAYGFSGSLGILGVVYDDPVRTLRIKMGGVYRFSSSCSADTGSDTKYDDAEQADISDKIVDQLVFSKPASFDIGFSLNKSITSLKSAFLFAGQYGETDWSKTNETIDNKYKKTSFGFEWQMNFEKSDLHLALRSGLYFSEASKPESGWPEVDGLTIGIGTFFAKNHWGLDVTHEYRDISYEGGKSDSVSLLSIAITGTYF
jgi:hypothetical protein